MFSLHLFLFICEVVGKFLWQFINYRWIRSINLVYSWMVYYIASLAWHSVIVLSATKSLATLFRYCNILNKIKCRSLFIKFYFSRWWQSWFQAKELSLFLNLFWFPCFLFTSMHIQNIFQSIIMFQSKQNKKKTINIIDSSFLFNWGLFCLCKKSSSVLLLQLLFLFLWQGH